MGRWRDHGADPPRLAVNVSGRQLDEAFVDDMMVALTAVGRPRPKIDLEITETLLLSATPGVSCSMPPTWPGPASAGPLTTSGTGYSSLTHLSKFPISKIKIDQSCRRPARRRHPEAIVRNGMAGGPGGRHRRHRNPGAGGLPVAMGAASARAISSTAPRRRPGPSPLLGQASPPPDRAGLGHNPCHLPARPTITMDIPQPAYVIGHITVKDPERGAHRQQVPATLAPWGAALRGRAVCRVSLRRARAYRTRWSSAFPMPPRPPPGTARRPTRPSSPCAGKPPRGT